MSEKSINAEVISVFPNKVRIAVDDLNDFKAGESLKVGSYIRVPSDDGETVLIAVIESFSIESHQDKPRKHLIDANPLGIIQDGVFIRGGDSIALPPKEAEPATESEINNIYKGSIKESEKLEFSSLSNNKNIRVPINGNKFFNKHIAIVGSTGSGKSHTLTKIIQTATEEKDGEFALNNSHVVIFDIHSEYQTAFPDANFIDVSNLVLPYWLLTSEELEELFLDSDSNDHNQRFIFRESVVKERKDNLSGSEVDKAKVHFDSPLFFDLDKVLERARSKNQELIDTGETYASGAKKGQAKTVQGSLYGKLT
ncbi:helicase HerA domain-containing protein, partial [Vibrio jasicida]|uniref:helicase HerA domain-containing protein n=3 Tax=Vibrio TaxID=662 RepID=UPI0011B0AF27